MCSRQLLKIEVVDMFLGANGLGILAIVFPALVSRFNLFDQ